MREPPEEMPTLYSKKRLVAKEPINDDLNVCIRAQLCSPLTVIALKDIHKQEIRQICKRGREMALL